MKKKKVKHEEKETKTGKPLMLKIVGFIVLIMSVLFYVEHNKNQDIEKDGVDNTAIVKSIDYVNYTMNEQTGHRVKYYQIIVDYNFNGNSYSQKFDLQPEEYKTKFETQLRVGDEINIKHAYESPLNVIIR
ncbi:hypothetical protein [Chondrinema litorale]|uniref:hypothetical protein n=1 Tax=Chondrinema litorale TaxID=2994555 RepID=UPI0025438FBF|nr:hypothetical protein [Chondrinema litorale]UZR98551.1 hypothetical protein OQ292_31605 [Chondrinema litorale]